MESIQIVIALILVGGSVVLTLICRTAFSETQMYTAVSNDQELPITMQKEPVELATTSIKSKSITSINALTPLFISRYSNYYSVSVVDLPSFQVSLVQTKYPTCADPSPDLPTDWDFREPIGAPLLVIFNKELNIIVGLFEFGDSSPTISLEEINRHPAVLISGINTGCGPGNSIGSGGLYEENNKLYIIPENLISERKVIHSLSNKKVDVDRIITFTAVDDY